MCTLRLRNDRQAPGPAEPYLSEAQRQVAGIAPEGNRSVEACLAVADQGQEDQGDRVGTHVLREGERTHQVVHTQAPEAQGGHQVLEARGADPYPFAEGGRGDQDRPLEEGLAYVVLEEGDLGLGVSAHFLRAQDQGLPGPGEVQHRDHGVILERRAQRQVAEREQRHHRQAAVDSSQQP